MLLQGKMFKVLKKADCCYFALARCVALGLLCHWISYIWTDFHAYLFSITVFIKEFISNGENLESAGKQKDYKAYNSEQSSLIKCW